MRVLCDQGADLLNGGDGADLFVVAADSGADSIAGFDGAGGDRIQIAANANGTTIDTFAKLQCLDIHDTRRLTTLAVTGASSHPIICSVPTSRDVLRRHIIAE